jgi:SAM-dependent methyltransferase
MGDGAERWSVGEAYEPYVGRWSRLVAREFIASLGVPAGRRWLDVGCGTGALTQVMLDAAAPREVVGVDPSRGFLDHARIEVNNRRARFDPGDARSLPYETATFDAVVSGLVLNFVPEPARAVAEMARVARNEGTVAAYIWDYAGEMQLMRHFWLAAALDPAARALDEIRRFAEISRPEALHALWLNAGLREVDAWPIDVPTRFRDFDDYWLPFLGGQGPAPSYVVSLGDSQCEALREHLRANLPIAPDGSIPLMARAWAVRGTR